MERRSRRELLRVSLFAAAALASGLRPGAARGQGRSTPKKRLGVALLGLGSYSEEELAPALHKTRFCTLRGLVTGTPSKIPKWQARHGIPDRNVYSYQTLPRIADNAEIDVVYVVVPPSLHATYAVMAAEAGKHVWCEKPMATSVEECERIIAACRKNGVKLSIGYRMHHEPNTQTVMAYARSKPYGEMKHAEAKAGFGGGSAGWRLQKSMGGGALFDMGVYCINGLRYASGREPVRVTRALQTTTRSADQDAADDTTEFELEFASGLRAQGRTSFVEEMNRLHVECEKGWYELAPFQSYTGVKGRTSDGRRLSQKVDNQQARQMDDDARAILDGREVMVPGEEGLRDIRIVRAIMRAAQSSGSADI